MVCMEFIQVPIIEQAPHLLVVDYMSECHVCSESEQ